MPTIPPSRAWPNCFKTNSKAFETWRCTGGSSRRSVRHLLQVIAPSVALELRRHPLESLDRSTDRGGLDVKSLGDLPLLVAEGQEHADFHGHLDLGLDVVLEGPAQVPD